MTESDLSDLGTSSEDEDNVVVKSSVVKPRSTSSPRAPPPVPAVVVEAAVVEEPVKPPPPSPKPMMPTMSRTAPLPPVLQSNQRRTSTSPSKTVAKAATATPASSSNLAREASAASSSASTVIVASTSASAAAAAGGQATEEKPKRNRSRTRGDADQECAICAATPASQRRATTRKEDTWVSCDACDRWFHWESCVKKYSPPKTTAESFEEWYCQECIKEAEAKGIQREFKIKEMPRKSSRKKADVKYASASSSKTGPNPWHAIAESRPLVSTRFREIAASDLTLSWLSSDPTAFSEPIFIASPEGLDMRVLPADIKISEIASLVGPETPIDVIDVASQSGLHSWTLGRWAEYYEKPGPREKIRNVISLELSSSPIKDRIASPRLVREIDWVERYWPTAALENGTCPKVSRYCLMSPGLSWTDWHIDFSASSVFYHILRGSKVFYFIAPTPANLRAYETWSGSSQQAQWLGDLCDRVYRVELQKGNTMIIPSGWIHCVYTPTDALVIGGNFLHDWNIALQLRVYQIELITKVPRRFRFPDFVKTLWYVGWHYLNILAPSNGYAPVQTVHPRILNGLKALSAFLIEQAYRLTAPGGTAPGAVSPERRRFAKEAVPWDLFSEPAVVAKTLQERVYTALGQAVPASAGVTATAAEGTSPDFPRFDAQEWLGPEWTYSLPAEFQAKSSVLNGAGSAAAANKRKAQPNGTADTSAAKTAKFKHFSNGAGPSSSAVPNGAAPPASGSANGEKKPRFKNVAATAVNGQQQQQSMMPAVNGAHAEAKAGNGQPEMIEKQNIPAYTVTRREVRQRPSVRPQMDTIVDPSGRPNLAAGLTAPSTATGAEVVPQEQEAEIKTTYSQSTVRKTFPGPEEGSWLVETRRVVTTIEKVYFAPLPRVTEEAGLDGLAGDMQIDESGVKDEEQEQEEEERPMEVLALQAASQQTTMEDVAGEA